MFNKDFYPTPDNVLSILLKNTETRGLKILEPSAGKGNIVDFIRKREIYISAKASIDVLEIEQELQSILFTKECNVVGSNFLDYETHTEYDLIVMNPPFSNGAKHLLKAIDLAEKQQVKDCTIKCILNSETLKNAYSDEREQLLNKINYHNGSYEYHKNLFVGSERSTNVEVALITIPVKATYNSYKEVFESIIEDLSIKQVNEYGLSTFLKSHQIEQREQDIYLYVRMYNEHIKHIKQLYSSMSSLVMYEKDVVALIKTKEENDYFNFYTLSVNNGFEEISCVIEKTRQHYWKLILESDKFSKLLTNNAREELSKMINNASSMEITIENIQSLLNALYQNKSNMLKESTLNLFRELTKNHMGEFAKNIHYYNGWKTNNAFKVGKKVIIKESNWYGEHDNYNSWQKKWKDNFNSNQFQDLIKALTPLTKDNLNKPLEHDGAGKYENDKFIIKCYKKGTTHITFKDLDLLDKFNIFCGQQMNMLPTDYEVKNSKKARDFMMKEFKNYNNDSSITLGI